MKRLILVSFIQLTIFYSVAFARLATIEDSSAVFEKSEIEYVINKDGSYLETRDVLLRIKTKEAVEKFGTYKLYSTADSEELKVLNATVINEGVKIEVDRKNIQSKSIATEVSLNSVIETAIVFPHLKENSLISLKYIIKKNKDDLSSIFTKSFEFGDLLVEANSHLKITSPFKIYFKINDPNKQIVTNDVTDSKGEQILEFSLKGPYINRLVEESNTLKAKLRTTVDVSNFKDWESLAKEYHSKLTSASEEKLPAELEKIIGSISEELSQEMKVKYLLKYIVTNYRYTGDWRELKGRMFPKKLSTLLADKYGDCKDFSNLLVKLLAALKIKASYGLVTRSYTPPEISKDTLPNLSLFNHMIVRIENNGKAQWIDPTNKLILHNKVRKDISGRFALNLDEKKASLEFISSLNTNEAESAQVSTYTFSSATDAIVKLYYKRSGEGALLLQDLLKDKTDQDIEKSLMNIAAIGENKVVTTFKSNFDHIEYKDLEMEAGYIVDKIGNRKKDEESFELKLPFPLEMLGILGIRKDFEGVIDLSMAPSFNNQYFYKKIFLTGELAEVCDIKSDWISASRKIELLDDGIVLVDKIKFLKKFLTKEDYQSESFGIVSNNLRNCFLYSTLSYNFGLSGHNISIAKFEKELASLPLEERLKKRIELAKKALNNEGREKEPGLTTEMARLLLEKNINESPEFVHSYVVMADYYLSSGYSSNKTYAKNNMEQAHATLDKALSIDPNYMSALTGKAIVYFYQKKFNEFQNIIKNKILPYDKGKMNFIDLRSTVAVFLLAGDLSNGLLYAQLALEKADKDIDKAIINDYFASYYHNKKDYRRCIEYYKKSIALDSKNAWTFGNLSGCYLSNNEFDLAIESAKKAISIMDYGVGRSILSYAYISRGMEYYKQKDFIKSEEMFNNALLNNKDYHIYIELIKVYSKQGELEKASRAARQAIDAYNGPVSNIVTLIAKAFDSDNPKYSIFMEKALNGLESVHKVSEVRYYVAYNIGMSKKKLERIDETKAWISSGINVLNSLIKNETDESRLVESQILMINFYLLDAYTTHSALSLEKANQLYAVTRKSEPENKKVILIRKYIEQANQAMGREPSSFGWKTKLFINKDLKMPIPDWLNDYL